MEAIMRLKLLILLLLLAPFGFLSAQTFVCSVEMPDASLGVFLGTSNSRYYYMGLIGGRPMPSYAHIELGTGFFTQRNWQERLSVWVISNNLVGAGSYNSTQNRTNTNSNPSNFGNFNTSNPTERFTRYTSGAVLISQKKISFAPWSNGISRYESKMYISRNRTVFEPYTRQQPNCCFQGDSPFTVYGVANYNPTYDVIFETVVYYIGDRVASTNVRVLDPRFAPQGNSTRSNTWYAISIDVK
jgi:hypothetical protein